MNFAEVVESSYNEYGLFHNLWSKVALELRNLDNVSMENVQEATEVLKNPFRKGERCSDFADIDFDDMANCCAYLMKFATCHTSLTKYATERFLDRVPADILDEVLSRDPLSVVSIGGGPGTDAIGFCNAVAHRQPSFSRRIKVCVMDLWKQWKVVQTEMMEAVATKSVGSHADFFRDAEIFFEFQQADLIAAASGGPSMPVDRLRTADVILCVKFLSILKDEDKYKVLKMVLSNMKHGSLLLFVDTQADFLSHWARMRRNLRIVLEPGFKKFYKLNCSCGDCIEKSSFQLCAVYKPMPLVIDVES